MQKEDISDAEVFYILDAYYYIRFAASPEGSISLTEAISRTKPNLARLCRTMYSLSCTFAKPKFAVSYKVTFHDS